jgi:hypothetical protein
MTNTIHPWTMYEVARSRDEERMLRAEEARRALRVQKDSADNRADTLEAASRFGRIRHLNPLTWAEGFNHRPHHVRHT